MNIWLSNLLWKWSLKKSYTSFLEHTKSPREKQITLLNAILEKNTNTLFGQTHHFDKITSCIDYQSVPISTYDDYKHYIDIIMNKTTENILTDTPPTLLEPTSGSTSGTKYIPYNKPLKEDFLKGINPWIYDLYQTKKISMTGTHYWSVSPLEKDDKHSDTGLPIGFEDDTDYLGSLGQFISKSLFKIPKEVKFISNIETFRYITVLFLLNDSNLSFISVWSPTFLIHLLDTINKYYVTLLNDLESGHITFKEGITKLEITVFEKALGKNRKRADKLRKIDPDNYHLIWPKLSCISCWGDADSASSKLILQERVYPIDIQEKGLIATEYFGSFPLKKTGGKILSIDSHYFEFLAHDQNSNQDSSIKLCDNLESGKQYILIVTTSGGLYRYHTGDIIEVSGYYNQTPLINFIGRQHTSDFYGEKLNTIHVNTCIQTIIKRHNLNLSFFTLSIINNDDPHYGLFYSGDIISVSILKELDQLLEENYHYRNCKHLSQLKELRGYHIKNGTKQYHNYMNSTGIKLGDIKPQVLLTDDGFYQFLIRKKLIRTPFDML